MLNKSNKQIVNSNASIGNNDVDYGPGSHPNSLANLKSWKKGESGNPNGRPTKYQKLADALLPYAEKRETKHKWNDNLEKFENIESEDNYREEVLEVIWQRARNGNIKYVELLAQLGCLD